MNKKQKEYFGYYSWCERIWLFFCNLMATMGYCNPLASIIFKEIKSFFTLIALTKPWLIVENEETIALVSKQGNARIRVAKESVLRTLCEIKITFDSQKREKQFCEHLDSIMEKYIIYYNSYVYPHSEPWIFKS